MRPGNSSNATLKYDWAVVSGGAPTHVARSGTSCSTFEALLPETMQYRGGLWLFARRPVDSTAAAAAEAKAKGKKQPWSSSQWGVGFQPMRQFGPRWLRCNTSLPDPSQNSVS